MGRNGPETGGGIAPMTARILSLRLGQFRSYVAGVIAAEGRSVALHGPNGAGKTNVLEAVSLLSPGRGLRRAGADELGRQPDSLGWRLRAEAQTPGGEIEIVTGARPDTPSRQVEIDGKTATQTALGHHLRIVWLTPAMDRLWMEGASERRRFLDRITLGFAPGHAEASLGYEKAMRDRNRLLKEGRLDPAWLGGLEAQMARHGARITRARAEALARLQDAEITSENDLEASRGEVSKNRPQTLFPKADLAIVGRMETRFLEVIRSTGQVDADLDEIESDEAAGLSHALSTGRGRDAAAGRTLEGPHRSDLEAIYAAKDMPARNCSTGEQKALLISLILANARALAAAGTPPILLLDEVAAHLDTDRRAALYAEIEALGCQAWMTGTEAGLFDGLGPDALHLAVTEQGGASVLERAP